MYTHCKGVPWQWVHFDVLKEGSKAQASVYHIDVLFAGENSVNIPVKYVCHIEYLYITSPNRSPNSISKLMASVLIFTYASQITDHTSKIISDQNVTALGTPIAILWLCIGISHAIYVMICNFVVEIIGLKVEENDGSILILLIYCTCN